MATVGSADGSNPINAPGTDGGGTGVPQNSVITQVTNLANAVAVDIAGTYRAVNAPTQPTFGFSGPGGSGFSIGLLPLILLGVAAWLVFRK